MFTLITDFIYRMDTLKYIAFAILILLAGCATHDPLLGPIEAEEPLTCEKQMCGVEGRMGDPECFCVSDEEFEKWIDVLFDNRWGEDDEYEYLEE